MSAAATAEKITNPEHLQSVVVNAADMPWQKTDFAGIEMKLLYSDPASGTSTLLFRMEPGAIVPLHEHTALEQTYVLSGSLADDEGEVTAGNYVWRPGGHRHVAHAPNGAVFISFFMRPNKFAQGTKFFTE